jgi:sulfatase modifying factor 1
MKIWLASIIIMLGANGFASEMKKVEGGMYAPLFGKGKNVSVGAFWVDPLPVTNAEYAGFVKANPNWKKGNAPALFVDADYLKHWATGDQVGNPKLERSPVVNVSWFAAGAYCESRGKRLPTVEEWEYLAQFGPIDESRDVKTVILEWYSKPTPKMLPSVQSTFKNKFGVWDMHGLVWEWTQDFNTAFVTGESRGDSALEKSMFCGAGAAGAADPSDYAAFMRFGFRSSLKGNYTVGNLGFRCAKGEK